MFSLTTLKLRKTGKLIVFLVFAFANSLICMESNDNAQEVMQKYGILEMPDEIILSFIEHCLANPKNEQELGKAISTLPKINKATFYRLMNDPQTLTYVKSVFENFKKDFLAQLGLNYEPMPYNVIADEKTLFSNKFWLDELKVFEKNKGTYSKISGDKRKRLEQLNSMTLEDEDIKKIFFAENTIDKEKFDRLKFDLGWLLLCNLENIDFQSPYSKHEILIRAIYRNQINLAKLLIYKGLDINESFAFTNNGGFSEKAPLIIICIERKGKEIAQKLIDLGANINVKDSTGMTALMCAVIMGNDEVVKLLIKNGALINAINIIGYIPFTPLTFALAFKNWKVALILMKEEFAKVNKSFAKYILSKLMF